MLLDQDESWFSRFKQPKMHAFSEKDAPLRLVERQPKPDENDKDIACFGAVCLETSERFFYFADGQPNSEKTILMLQALIAMAQSRSKRVLVIIWDRATWHKSKRIKSWAHSHNRQVKEYPDGDLSVMVLKQRLCAAFNTTLQNASLHLSA